MTGIGEYCKIVLFRAVGRSREITEIGVGLQGEVVSYEYYSDGQSFNIIHQFNGMDAEVLARQMEQESDPPWTR